MPALRIWGISQNSNAFAATLAAYIGLKIKNYGKNGIAPGLSDKLFKEVEAAEAKQRKAAGLPPLDKNIVEDERVWDGRIQPRTKGGSCEQLKQLEKRLTNMMNERKSRAGDGSARCDI